MSFTDSPLMRLLTQKMAYLNQRQSVLAENVANANVPNYKARDLEPFSFETALNQSKSIGMATTDPRHIVPASMAGVNSKTVKAKPYETLLSGNTVDLEQQMMNVSANSVDHQTVSSIYHQIMSWYRIAIKGS